MKAWKGPEVFSQKIKSCRLASPFLDVMERMLAEGDDDRDDDEDDDHYDDNVDDHDDHDDGNDHADNDQHSNDSEEDYRNLMSDIIFPLDDEDEQDANGNDSQTENVNEDDSNSSGDESEELFTGSEEDWGHDMIDEKMYTLAHYHFLYNTY